MSLYLWHLNFDAEVILDLMTVCVHNIIWQYCMFELELNCEGILLFIKHWYTRRGNIYCICLVFVNSVYSLCDHCRRIVMEINARWIMICLLFSEEGGLSWMYKDKVDSEEFLLGRRIDNAALNDPEPSTQSKCHHWTLFFMSVHNVWICSLSHFSRGWGQVTALILSR